MDFSLMICFLVISFVHASEATCYYYNSYYYCYYYYYETPVGSIAGAVSGVISLIVMIAICCLCQRRRYARNQMVRNPAAGVAVVTTQQGQPYVYNNPAMAQYPGQQTGFVQQPGYPSQLGAYPQQATAYPQQPAPYPQQPAPYPQQPSLDSKPTAPPQYSAPPPSYDDVQLTSTS